MTNTVIFQIVLHHEYVPVRRRYIVLLTSSHCVYVLSFENAKVTDNFRYLMDAFINLATIY